MYRFILIARGQKERQGKDQKDFKEKDLTTPLMNQELRREIVKCCVIQNYVVAK